MIRIALFFALLMSLAAPVAAQSGEPLPPAEAFRLSAQIEDGETRLRFDIEDGYYLYREHLSAEGPKGEIPIATAPGIVKDDPTFGRVEIYYDTATASLPATDGNVTITWQGCQDEGICYPPQRVSLDAIPASASASAETGASEAGGPFSGPRGMTSAPTSSDADPALPASSGTAGITLAEDRGIAGFEGGAGLVVLTFFGLGLLLSVTPCVFPMFPIVAGMVTGQGKDLTMGRGIALTGTYVVAMAAAFGFLGVVAAWSGQNLQMALQSPWAVGGIAALFVVFALTMFGAFDIALPSALTTRVQRIGGRGGSLGGAAGLGFTSALIVGPCVTAPLAGALLYIARTGDVALGAAALFALGLGQGVPLLAIGAFGAQILPRAGAWMERAKQAFGIVFLGLAIWMIGRIVPGPLALAFWATLLVGTGVFLGALDRLSPEAGGLRRGATSLGLLALLGGGLQAVGAASGAHDPLRPLAVLAGDPSADDPKAVFANVTDSAGLDGALDAATGPSMVYVTADWCTSCRMIERHALADADVQSALADLAPISVDVSDFGPASQALLDELGSVGPPTMVFLDAGRREVPGTRLVGEVGSADMLGSLAGVSR
ncbi:protein-disulfide reductase DsbD [Palleronia sp. LCG004]|uniref:protein-disulfide reductase DsbD n=1 Tax=Palleronia sp. LCG004 TaxID=3079304 RepID=UPI00294215A0|nr:protein-disulfide reductase DsbD [Palleronia sp. LCG004]WOI57959.1 protein-disulfide reductase DsbD [Palleronia sp. LCG004]